LGQKIWAKKIAIALRGRSPVFKELGAARLKRLLKNAFPSGLVPGHDFRRADKPFIRVIPSRL
jgi:hypothetical protein